jgi:hypothetical protein
MHSELSSIVESRISIRRGPFPGRRLRPSFASGVDRALGSLWCCRAGRTDRSPRLVHRSQCGGGGAFRRRGRGRRRADRYRATSVSCGLQRCSPCALPAFSICTILPDRGRDRACYCLLPQQPRPAPMAAPLIEPIAISDAAPSDRLGMRSKSCGPRQPRSSSAPSWASPNANSGQPTSKSGPTSCSATAKRSSSPRPSSLNNASLEEGGKAAVSRGGGCHRRVHHKAVTQGDHLILAVSETGAGRRP